MPYMPVFFFDPYDVTSVPSLPSVSHYASVSIKKNCIFNIYFLFLIDVIYMLAGAICGMLSGR